MELIQKLLKYIELKIEFSRLSLQQGIVRFLVAISLAVLLCLPAVIGLLFLSFSLAFGIGSLTGNPAWGFLVVSVIYSIVVYIIYLQRENIQKRLFEKIEPLIITQESNDSDPAYVQQSVSKSETDSGPLGNGVVSEGNQN